MNSTNLDKPLYIQIYDDMLRKILSKEWPVGTRIPGEIELCESYNVSRMTVRLAMKELVGQGYLDRKQGRGSFVTESHIIQKLDRFYSFNYNGTGAKSKVIQLVREYASTRVAKNMQLEPGAVVYRLERLRYSGDVIFAYENSYIPEAYGKYLNREMIEEIGLYRSIHQTSNVLPRTAVETIEAVSIREKEAEYLKVKPNHPVMLIERIANGDQGIMEYCISIVRGDKIKYRIELQ